MAVGGSSDRRGVITTCNYEARSYGVRSAMASATALRKCPDLVLVSPRFDAYREASAAMREVFLEYSEQVEPLSLDEAFIDVSAVTRCQGSATLMAEEIRARVRESVGITVSAGVAPSKFLAKVASDWNKPDGLCVVTPEEVDSFVAKLPIDRIFGVGQVTAGRLQRMGVTSCGDLRNFSIFELADRFGSFGKRLYELCRGIDHRPVKPSRRRKSLSIEHTFSSNLSGMEACEARLPELLAELRKRLSRIDDDYLVTGVFIKIKFDDFSQTTVERSCGEPGLSILQDLCRLGYSRGEKPVRLLGMGVRFLDLQSSSPDQLELFEHIAR